MRRVIVVGLAALVVMGAGVTASLLKNNHSAPLPSEDELRTNGFAVWPEDTVDEGIAACEEAESWRLDSGNAALRFAGDLLNYPEPYVSHTIEDWAPQTIRYFVNNRGVASDKLPMVIDVRKYDRCWFVVGATPREGGWPATVSFVHPAGQAHLAIHSEGEQTQIGYGSWERSFATNKQQLFDISEVARAATGHVITMACGQVCDASAWTLGSVPEPATTEVAPLTLSELRRTRGICRNGGHRSRFRALADLYAATLQKPIREWHGGKPQIGGVVVKREAYFLRRGIEPLGGHRWSYTVDGTELQARIVRFGDKCWNIISTDDPAREVLNSLHVGQDSFTFDARWGRASSAYVSMGCRRGGDSWDIQRLNSPITVIGLVCQPLDEPFSVSVDLRNGPTSVSYERSWYRTR